METKVPIDINAIEPKRVFGLTARQMICFTLAALTGIPVFILIRFLTENNSLAMIGLVAAASPALVLLVYQRNGLHTEVILKDWLKWKRMHPQRRRFVITRNNLEIARQRGMECRRKGGSRIDRNQSETADTETSAGTAEEEN